MSNLIAVGDEFTSLAMLENAIRRYEDETATNLIKISSRTIEGARKKGLKRFVSPELVFTEITYACIKYGVFKSQSRGVRPNQKSFRDGCPVKLKFGLSQDGLKLSVKSFVTEHNHVQSQAIYNHLPRQRRLDTEAKHAAAKLISMKVNKKIIQNELMKEYGKIVTLKDINNLTVKHSKDEKTTNVLEAIVSRYKQQTDISIEIMPGADNNMLGIFYQDNEMKRMFSLCPEIVFIDAVCKDNEIKNNVYVILIEDSNGLSEIVGLCLLTSNDYYAISSMAEVFKKHNPCWNKILTIMAGRELTERNALKKHFPGANLLICIFNCLRTMFKEITLEKMRITKAQRKCCLEILKNMVHATSEESYMKLYNQLRATKLKMVIEYFEINWHSIRDEWVFSLQSKHVTLGNRTSNRLESINQRITDVVSKFSRIDQLFEGFDFLITNLRTERDGVAATAFAKTSVLLENLSKTELDYYHNLTPFAYKIVAAKFLMKDQVKIACINVEQAKGIVKIESGNAEVTATKCNCSFNTSMLLPCHHIFKLREMCNLPLYSADLFAERWSLQYYTKVCRLFQGESKTVKVNNEASSSVMCTTTDLKNLNPYERVRVALKEAKLLSSLACESTGIEFQKRISLMTKLRQYWEKNIACDIVTVNLQTDEELESALVTLGDQSLEDVSSIIKSLQ